MFVKKWELVVTMVLLLIHTAAIFTTCQKIIHKHSAPAQENRNAPVQTISSLPDRIAYNLPSRSGTPRVPTTIEAIVTAYTKNDPGMDGKGITFTGTKARPGIAAVDPAVIPLGSVLYVPGYGYARAEDIGGAIKGNRIDLYFENRSDALKWGRKRMRVEIVQLSQLKPDVYESD